MLSQAGRMSVPGTDAYFAMSAVRGTTFGLGVYESSGLVTDWGFASELVTYIARQRRAQLSIVLDGRGYFDLGCRIASLGPGDVVLSDQSQGAHEGYAGAPLRVLLVDWERQSPLGPPHTGAPQLARISRRDVTRLRTVLARRGRLPPRRWACELIDVLRTIGLPATRITPADLPSSPELERHLGRLYAALADVRSHLHEHPAIGDVAGALEVSERHVRRAFDELDRELGTGTGGWREFLADTRLATAQQLLSIPALGLARVAALSGFRSSVALCHAFAARGACTPGELARRTRERWDLPALESERDPVRAEAEPSAGLG